MILDTQKTEKFLIAKITEQDANLEIADKFRDEIFALIEQDNHRVVLNFEEVTYVDSSFLGAMVAGLKKALSLGGDIFLVELKKDIYNMMHLIRMDKVFKIYTHAADIE
ncbi:MAG TPA: STAS domain-containing protein [Chitinophagaceae bacterium]|nr:STAS domain-containing protein [Chitinophagaceae bacterium]